MKFVKAADVLPGMQVAKAICLRNQSVPIIQKDMILTEDMISQIRKLNIYGVYIEDGEATTLPLKQILQFAKDLCKNKAVDDMAVEEIEELAERIVAAISFETPVALLLQGLYHYQEGIYEHSRCVAKQSVILALHICDDMETIGELALAGLLHDIGKMKIKPDILQKTEGLTELEKEQQMQHVMLAHQFIKKCTFISDRVTMAILQHHENFDGTGYPSRTKGKSITLMARILHVVDAYDGLVAKNAYTQQEAMEYLTSQSEKQFDPAIVKLFLEDVLMITREDARKRA